MRDISTHVNSRAWLHFAPGGMAEQLRHWWSGVFCLCAANGASTCDESLESLCESCRDQCEHERDMFCNGVAPLAAIEWDGATAGTSGTFALAVAFSQSLSLSLPRLSLSLPLLSLSLPSLSLSLSRSLSLSLSRSLSFFSLSQTVVVHNKSNNNNDIRQNIGLLRKNCSQNWFKGKCAGNQLTLK